MSFPNSSLSQTAKGQLTHNPDQNTEQPWCLESRQPCVSWRKKDEPRVTESTSSENQAVSCISLERAKARLLMCFMLECIKSVALFEFLPVALVSAIIYSASKPVKFPRLP